MRGIARQLPIPREAPASTLPMIHSPTETRSQHSVPSPSPCSHLIARHRECGWKTTNPHAVCHTHPRPRYGKGGKSDFTDYPARHARHIKKRARICPRWRCGIVGVASPPFHGFYPGAGQTVSPVSRRPVSISCAPRTRLVLTRCRCVQLCLHVHDGGRVTFVTCLFGR